MDSLQIYLRDIARTPLLTRDEERHLFTRLAARDPDNPADADAARDQIIRANLRLVVNIARRYQGNGIPLEDLIEEGNTGLIHAVVKFELSRGNKFCTYASYWIRQPILLMVRQSAKLIHTPTCIVDLTRRFRRRRIELYADLGQEPTAEEVIATMHLDPRQAFSLEKALCVQDAMFYGSASEDSFDSSFIDGIPERSPQDFDAGLVGEEVAAIMKDLDAREQNILRMRLGLGGNRPMILKEIGELLDLTRERVRQIEYGAIKKLKRHFGLLKPSTKIPANRQRKRRANRFASAHSTHR